MRLQLRYTLVGILLATGSPLGLIALRAALAHTWPGPDFVLGLLRADPVLWTYLFGGAVLFHGLAGFIAGCRAGGLLESAHTDPLTGLSNRRYLDLQLKRAMTRYTRHGRASTLVLADLDHLKRINDAGGHPAGDRAIHRVAAALREACRADDVAARVGGDEFAVLVRGSGTEGGLTIAARIQEHLRSLGPDAPTLSIGVASMDHPSGVRDTGTLYELADRALYAAKAGGRDQVVAAADLPQALKR